jgi:hypothetical protein
MRPPKDVEPCDLFLKLQETPAPSEVIDFPRKDPETGEPVFQVRIMVLGMTDHHWARLRARAWAKKEGLDKDDLVGPSAEVYGDIVARYLLFRAVRHPNPIKGSEDTEHGLRYPYFFPKPEAVDDVLRSTELESLFNAYILVQNKWGPFEGSIDSDAELTAWVKMLAEGASMLPLARRDWHQLAELSLLLARRAYILSAHLESQSSSLPDTSAAVLETLGIGIGWFGSEPATTTDDGSEADGEPAAEWPEELPHPLNRPPPGEPITTEQAANLARMLRPPHADS